MTFIGANVNPETVRKFIQGSGGLPNVGEYELGAGLIFGTGYADFSASAGVITVDSFLASSDWDDFAFLRNLTEQDGHVLICTPVGAGANICVSASYNPTTQEWTITAKDTAGNSYTGEMMLVEIVPFRGKVVSG